MTPETLAIETSDAIGNLFAALAAAQGEIKNASKDRENPHFKSMYADLASVYDACRTALSKHGIGVVQMPTNLADAVAVTTRIGIKDGEWMQSTIAAKPAKFDAQGVGSVITYLRRYGLAAMVGVAPGDDDDGEGATERAPTMRQSTVAGPPSAAVKKKPETPPKALDPAAWWRGGSLLIPIKAGEGLQAWHGRFIKALSSAPDIDALNRLVSDNGSTLDGMQAENAKAYAVLTAAIKAQTDKLATQVAAE